MITVEEANALLTRLAASNILMRGLICDVLPVEQIAAVDKVCKANSEALKDFAAAHPETLTSWPMDIG